MMEPEKNEQDVFIVRQQQEPILPNTDEVLFPTPLNPSRFLARLGLTKTKAPLSDPLKALKSKNWQMRVLALQALADWGRKAPVPLIRACLQDPHEAVRMATVRTLGKLWEFGTIPLEPFLLALGDQHAEVRVTTVQVMESLGPEALIKSLIAHLTEKLQQEETIVRIAIIHLLGTLGKNAPIDELVTMLNDQDWQVREAAVSALGSLSDHTLETPLLNALYDKHRFVRDAAISALGERLPVEVFIHDLLYGDTSSRKKAAELLGELGERLPQQPVINALVQAARSNRDSSVRKAALLALGQIGMPISLTALRPLLDDKDQDVREVAMLVLDALHPGFFNEQGEINPDSFDDRSSEELEMDYPLPHRERDTEQAMMPVSSRKIQSNAREADYTGRRFGNYRLLRQLARGGQATIYLGEHVHLYTKAAVKVLYTHLSDQDVQRFLEEARTIANLTHPNIVRVLDASVEDGIPYIAMDYMPQGPLRKLLAPGLQMQVRIVIAYVKQLASALDYAHNHRVIHLDIKPENILLGENNTVLLSDFGIARRVESETNKTKETVAGTRSYAAPEQLQGKPVEASDQYALAIIVYEMLTGSHPYEATYAQIRGRYLNYFVQPLHKKNPHFSRKVRKVILQALAKQPENRYPNVQAFAVALEKAFPTRRTIFNFLQRRKGK